jgi:hypothetical protein
MTFKKNLHLSTLHLTRSFCRCNSSPSAVVLATSTQYFLCVVLICGSWSSSVSIVCDYRLGDRGSISGRGKGFFIQPVNTRPAYPLGTRFPFSRVNRGRGLTLTTHHHLVPRSRMSRSYTLSTLAPTWRAAEQLYFFTLLYLPEYPIRRIYYGFCIHTIQKPGVSFNLLYFINLMDLSEE